MTSCGRPCATILPAIVGDEQNRDAVMLVPLTQVAGEKRLRRTVQRSQWLIEQQRARLGHQSARQGDALAFASRDLHRSPVAQAIDAKQPEYLAAAPLSLCRAQPAKTVRHVLLRSQVREERQLLMHVPDVPFPGCNIPLLFRVVKIFTANRNAPFVGFAQPGNAIQHRGLSRARSAEKNGETGQRAEVDIQVEAALGIRKAFADANFELGRDWRWRCLRGGLRRRSSPYLYLCLHRHGPTTHERRFKPYTIDNTTKETMSSTSAVWFALA